MKKTIDFLTRLQKNNNKPWFDEHKEEYLQAADEFNETVGRLIPAIAAFDPDVAKLTVKDCTYRIYRDMRFSPNKEPYKTYMGAYICQGGKKSWSAGYYLHIEPPRTAPDGSRIGGYLLSPGLYRPEPDVLRSVREEIFDNGAQFLEAVRAAADFRLVKENSLTRNPAGFSKGPYDEYIRLRDFYLEHRIPDHIVSGRDLVEYAAEKFRTARDFVAQLNRAVLYALEEK